MCKPKLELGGVRKEDLPTATQEEIERLKAAFDNIDADGSGSIDESELTDLLVSLGKDPTGHEVQSMMQLADKDGNGTIEFDEFCALYGKQLAKEEHDSEAECLAECFRVFDMDGNGYIERKELAQIMGGLGTNSFRAPSEAMIDELIKCADLDGDGKINYDEFVKVMLDGNTKWPKDA